MSYHDIDLQTKSLPLDRYISKAALPRARTSAYRFFGKRALDIGLSLALLPLLVPIMAVIWAMIRCDGAAALFCQPRVGKNGRVFSCYKFRTMVPEAEQVLAKMIASDPEVAKEWHEHQKLRSDSRITRIGALLRMTSLDELPQLFNVLKGDMSLVGPRPFLPSQAEMYRAAGGRAYYDLRPGVTGLWQVFCRQDTTFAARVCFDEAYSANLSAIGDLSLILRTAKAVLSRTGC